MAKRMTKSELQDSLGAFNPVGHAVLAFGSDAVAADAKQALIGAGFADQDILAFTSAELFGDLNEMLRNVSDAAGFGYEINLMRRYVTLAGEGCGWLVVYSPEEEQIKQIVDVAKRYVAKSAVHYGRLASEDLI